VNKKLGTDEELKQLSALVLAGGTALRAAARCKRRIISCRAEDRCAFHVCSDHANEYPCEMRGGRKDVSEVGVSPSIGVAVGIAMAWSTKFNYPIKWGAQTLRTLHDARDYILKLPSSKQMLPAWQAATEALLEAAKHGGVWLELARIGMMQALLELKPVAESSASNERWGKRKLASDR
jgi:hypothetical protein